MNIIIVLTILSLGLTSAKLSRPNIVFFLTDDQDQMLGGSFPPTSGSTPMPKTQSLMQDQGTMATNFWIHTPICCPSRSELVTGRYFHNIKMVGKKGTCMHANLTTVNGNTFAKNLQEEAGYKVGLFGKYLNSGWGKAPEGFDAWLANGGGNYIAPKFATYNIDGLPNGTWQGGVENYTTAVVGNTSIHWIKKVAAENAQRRLEHGEAAEEIPFFAYIAPKAAHEPFNPAPWYVDHWDPSWPSTEPRPPNWNCTAESRADHHGNIATQSMITAEGANVITDVFKNRWRTLMSVDDVIADVIQVVTDLGMLDNTYFFYTSDHGFQLGEFNILMDKRQVYDTNTRIHLLARGPGIPQGSVWHAPATQVDLAPTFLGLAGIQKPDTMDGHSILPFLISSMDTTATDPTIDPPLPDSTRVHLEQLGSSHSYSDSWRDSLFFEYYYVSDNDKCVQNCTAGPQYPNGDSACGILTAEPNKECWGPPYCFNTCYPTETVANNFIGIRHTDPNGKFGDTLYAEFQSGSQYESNIDFTNVTFVEYYNVTDDKWQMNNLYRSTDPNLLNELSDKLHEWYKCAGKSCP